MIAILCLANQFHITNHSANAYIRSLTNAPFHRRSSHLLFDSQTRHTDPFVRRNKKKRLATYIYLHPAVFEVWIDFPFSVSLVVCVHFHMWLLYHKKNKTESYFEDRPVVDVALVHIVNADEHIWFICHMWFRYFGPWVDPRLSGDFFLLVCFWKLFLICSFGKFI